MTENIFKRLKESIDRNNVVAQPQQSNPSSILPSQISDAYLTNQSKRGPTPATLPQNAPQTAKLSTIIEQQ